jgi:SanA protein
VTGGAWARPRVIRTGLRILLGGFFAILAVLLAGSFWVRREAAGHLYEQVSLVPPREVAIVLGASVHRSGKPSPVVEARLAAALALVRGKQARKILVSGDHRPDEYDEVQAMKRWLVRAGVSPDLVMVDRAGLRTFDSMERAARVFSVKSAVVCTQSFHLPRAVFLARRAGIDAIGLRTGGGLVETGLRDLLRESLATVRALFDAQLLK